jgi:hypothetical protein
MELEDYRFEKKIDSSSCLTMNYEAFNKQQNSAKRTKRKQTKTKEQTAETT